mmetsp:Transcript_10133/g.25293  ORF Transcript_10133/g.25293 Transcript_10133/m.25293 type:complete len:212 (+) Transcript_10133:499-1134(+)
MVQILPCDDPHHVVVGVDNAEVPQPHGREERVRPRRTALLPHGQRHLIHVGAEVEEEARTRGLPRWPGHFGVVGQASQRLVDAVHDLPFDLQPLERLLGAPSVPLPQPLPLVEGLHLVLERVLQLGGLLFRHQQLSPAVAKSPPVEHHNDLASQDEALQPLRILADDREAVVPRVLEQVQQPVHALDLVDGGHTLGHDLLSSHDVKHLGGL